MSAKPKPKVVREVCTLCGLDWKDHGDAPTADTCVRLLLDEVASLSRQLAARPIAQPIPYVPYVPTIPRPWRPYWPAWYTTTDGTTITPGATNSAIPTPSPLQLTA